MLQRKPDILRSLIFGLLFGGILFFTSYIVLIYTDLSPFYAMLAPAVIIICVIMIYRRQIKRWIDKEP